MPETHVPSNLLQVLRGEFLPYLQTCRDPDRLTELIERLASLLRADAAILWRYDEERMQATATWGCVPAGWPENFEGACAGTEAFQNRAAVLRHASGDAYSHDATGESLEQVLAFPVRGPRGQVGSIEMWWRTGSAAAAVSEVVPLLEDAINETVPALLEYEAERRNYINAISRLMMLYDIGKVFHSTIELGEMGPLILSRVQNILEAEAAAVWLLDPVKKNLYCAAAAGPYRAEIEGSRVWASDEGLGVAASQGDAVLEHNVENPAWTQRWGSPIRSLMAVPLMAGGKLLGAIEAVRAHGQPYFSEEDLRLMIDVCKQAAVSLRNAQQHLYEKRVNELNALMEISKEITATLDLDKVLTTTVNRITSVIPAERCAISLLRRGKWELSAISGEMKVDQKNPVMAELAAIHIWLAGSEGDIVVSQTDEGISADREETRDKFAGYFQQSGMRAFNGLLLKDEEGVVGVLTLEAKEAEALTPSHTHLARIFASQVTVALRNAMLYQRVPLIGVLQPLVEKQAKFGALPVTRRRIIIGAVTAAAAFLIFFPWWSKPAGEARVLPARVLPVSAEVEGTVRRVMVKEGDRIEAGQTLAELAPEPHRVALEQARAQYDILGRKVLQLESVGNLGEARLERARLQQASAELELYRTRLDQTHLRSPISGVVVTPRLEERVGQLLKRGDVFGQVVNLDSAWVEVAVAENEVGEIGPGQEAWVKLNTFPERKFVGQVVRVSPQGREQADARVFDVIVEIPNDEGLLRPGMSGRGKILARRASVGYLLARAPARWLWLKIWSMLP